MSLVCISDRENLRREINKATTSRNLTYAEDRIRKLEATISTLLPNVDIEALLNSSSPQPSGDERLQEPERSQKPTSMAAPKDGTAAPEAASEALPQLADGFDWAEKELTLSGLSDGMAALSIRPEGAGYLGTLLATRSMVMFICLSN